MTKKDIAKHSAIATTTLFAFLATSALLALMILKFALVPLSVNLFVKALLGSSPSGLAAGGIALIALGATVGVFAAPFAAAWYTQKMLSKACWGNANFYWHKTSKGQAQKQREEFELAKEYHDAMIIVAKELEACKKEEDQQKQDPQLLQKDQNQKLGAPLLALQNLLKEKSIASPKDYITQAEQCTQAREKCTLARKQFTLSRSGA